MEEPFLILTAQVPEFTVVPWQIVVLVLLLLASALVSGAEVAFFSLSATRREELGTRSDQASLRILRLLGRPEHLLIAILVLNTVINVSAAILAALITESVATSLGLSRELVFALEIVALTFVLLIVSEITPKLIASRYPVGYSRRVAGVLSLLYRMLYPLVALLAWLLHSGQDLLQRWWNGKGPEKLSPDDLKVMADIGKAHGSIEDEEHRWIQSLVDFGDTKVRAIMINRMDIVALPSTASLEEAFQLIRNSGHSRLPVHDGHLDEIRGVLYAKDLLPYLNDPDAAVDWVSIVRPPMFAPMSMKLDDLLQDFQKRKTHLAIVVDEFGGTAGLVTLDDVLEEVVGEIQDEHDEPAGFEIEPVNTHTYRVDAGIPLDELNERLRLGLPTDDYPIETVGGLVLHLAGVMPEAGHVSEHAGLKFRVERVEDNRILTICVQLPVPSAAPEDPLPPPSEDL
ncbi:MAG: hemolysin family protein [Bacteroidota bacterium]|nr:hemolysin family protein [Bacteroidota bacterium]MDE2835668.1 hemolysin family protein [Bacteroidota bacterium]MDE2955391.1 hemolysin family protein [Bacteroidota bacterium]